MAPHFFRGIIRKSQLIATSPEKAGFSRLRRLLRPCEYHRRPSESRRGKSFPRNSHAADSGAFSNGGAKYLSPIRDRIPAPPPFQATSAPAQTGAEIAPVSTNSFA